MHAIALVPGFLGFDHNGHVTYFADRFLAGLQAIVESKVGQNVFVAPVVVPPIGSLAKRQAALIAALDKLEARHNGGEHFDWHLLGHSTGGLDAAFLTRTKRLADSDEGTGFGHEALDERRVKSVTTLSTPHYGTCLALADLPAATAAGTPISTRLKLLKDTHVVSTIEALFDRDAMKSRLNFVEAAQAANTGEFLMQFVTANQLARDLRPNVAGKLTAEANRRAVPIFSIATVTPAVASPPPSDGDRLFEMLWTWTQQRALEAAETDPPPAIEDGPAVRIAAAPDKLPAGVIGPRENDGVVSTNRQVFIGANATFAGLVLGDHADVMGRYRRLDALDGEPLDPGLLTSTASFGDAEFFALLRCIAGGICSVIK